MNPMKHFLLTGGTGFIGKHLIKALELDHKVTVLTRKDPQKFPRSPNVTYVDSVVDINFDNIGVVINLAGEPIANKRWSEQQKKEICDSRWEMTEMLIDAIADAKVRPQLLINASAIGFYGRQNELPIDETFTNIHDEFSHKVCKRWEEIALQAKDFNVRTCITRFGIVIGPKGGALAKMLPAYYLCLGGPMGNGKQYMSWIHIDDVVGGILHLVENQSLEGIFNFTAPGAVPNQEFSQILADTLNRPNFMKMPSFVLKTLFGEMSELFLYGQNVTPKRLIDSGYQFQYPQLGDGLANATSP